MLVSLGTKPLVPSGQQAGWTKSTSGYHMEEQYLPLAKNQTMI